MPKLKLYEHGDKIYIVDWKNYWVYDGKTNELVEIKNQLYFKVVKREIKGVKISQTDGEWKVETYLEKVSKCK